MNLSFQESLFLIVAGSVLIVALGSVLVRALVLSLFDIKRTSPRVRFPWRFSLMAVTVLVILAACVFGLLRASPGAAAAGFALVLLAWLAVVRFLGLQQVVSDRRNKELAATIERRKAQSVAKDER